MIVQSTLTYNAPLLSCGTHGFSKLHGSHTHAWNLEKFFKNNEFLSKLKKNRRTRNFVYCPDS